MNRGTETSDLALRQWMIANQASYDVLFDDGYTSSAEVLADPGAVALTALSRHTKVPRNHDVKSVLYDKSQAEVAIDCAIDATVEGGFGDAVAEVFTDTGNNLKMAKNATSKLVHYWERVLISQRLASPFAELVTEDVQPDDGDARETKLIQMTLAALTVSGSLYTKSRQAQPYHISGIRYYGPTFTSDFMSGKNMEAYFGPETARQLSLIPSKQCRILAIQSPRRLRQKIAAMAAKLESQPTNQELALALEWPEEDVAAFFTDSVRERMLVHHSAPFIGIAHSIKHALEKVATSSNIADKLNIDQERAFKIFSPGTIRDILVESPFADPIEHFRDLLDGAERLKKEYPYLSDYLAVKVLKKHGSKTDARMKLVDKQMADRPSSMSRGVWAEAVIDYPQNNDPRRIKRHIALIALSKSANATGLLLSNPDAVTNHPGLRSAPEEVIFAEDRDGDDTSHEPWLEAKVSTLMDAANLSEAERQQLLDFFASDSKDHPPEITALIERMRESSKYIGGI